MKSRLIWSRADGLVALLAAGISFAFYAWSAAPNVTLLDSGEFIVAAQHFGVPHPTGYPLWTLLTWIFQLLPLGNAAWEINLFSGVCAALAVGLCAALLSNIQTWCLETPLQGRVRFVPPLMALAFALMLAFSQSMWSQAVIAEVYALHALLIALFLLICYAWVRNPANDSLMFAAFFLLALSFSNHQLTMSLGALPYLLIILLRRRCFLDWMFAGLLTLLLGYLGFAILSRDPAVLKTALRFFYCVVLALAVFAWMRKFRIRWRLIAFLPLAVALGLLPHAYMPLASATNPPMNWGYAREPEGFFFSINRSQYPGSLSEMTVKSLGRLTGVTALQKAGPTREKPKVFTGLQMVQRWVGFFWQKLSAAFTPLALIGYFASILFVLRLPLDRRTWIYFLHVAFLLAAFLQPLVSHSKIDNSEWWTQMPYHGYTNLIFALLAGLGLGLGIIKLTKKYASAFWLAPAMLILPVFTFLGSEPTCNQRGHWFGWEYGHDMLKDLPPNSIMIGGTDAGRFVPTYMIFGESSQAPEKKRDPDFDRRDLTIITQNALGEPNYMKYLRDHYTTARPEPGNAFERWLGRGETYPDRPIRLPDEKQIAEGLKSALEAQRDQKAPKEDLNLVVFSSVLKWIWEKNRDTHDFFVEESFPIVWTYDYAIPHGLIYQLNKTRVESLTPEMVEKDFQFWKNYKARLLGNPRYRNDVDAQRSFSKLRQTTGNIYRHHKMTKEAERAYWEALELWPDNVEVLITLMSMLWDQKDFKTPIQLYIEALERDPDNFDLWRLRILAEQRRDAQDEIIKLTDTLTAQPKSRDTLRKLLALYSNIGDTNGARPFIERALQDFPNDADMLRDIVTHLERHEHFAETLDAAKQLTLIEGSNLNNHLLLARAYFFQNKKKEFYETAEHAVTLGGEEVRNGFRNEPIFLSWTNDPEFQKLVKPSPLTPK
jgi:tetratricopeptide (TPR) repeat protein